MGYTPISEVLDTICNDNIFAIKERVRKDEKHEKSEEVKEEKNMVITNILNPGLTHLTRLHGDPTITNQSEQTPQKIQRNTWKDVLLKGVVRTETMHSLVRPTVS